MYLYRCCHGLWSLTTLLPWCAAVTVSRPVSPGVSRLSRDLGLLVREHLAPLTDGPLPGAPQCPGPVRATPHAPDGPPVQGVGVGPVQGVGVGPVQPSSPHGV